MDEETLKQLEEKYGLDAPERTEVIIGFENMLNMVRYGLTIVQEGLDNFWDAKFVSIFPIYFSDGVQEASSLVKNKGIKIRIITEIKEDNLESVKKISDLFEVRHLQGITGNFGILDRKQYMVLMFSAYDKPPEQSFFSNSKTFVKQQQYIFDTLWENATPSRLKIKQIEMAKEPDFINSTTNQRELSRILTELIECSIKEILVFLPRLEASNHLGIDIFEILRAATIRAVDVRVIIAGVAQDDKHRLAIEGLNKNILVRYLPTELPNNRVDIIIDYKFTISIEDPGKSTDEKEGTGLVTYSNVESKAMVSSSIFENYWMKAR